jgi:hypothetical protein
MWQYKCDPLHGVVPTEFEAAGLVENFDRTIIKIRRRSAKTLITSSNYVATLAMTMVMHHPRANQVITMYPMRTATRD